MSGIAGFLNRDGRPVDANIVEPMTAFLEHVGPDASSNWRDGPVALCHSLFRTVEEHERDVLPLSLHDRLTITADARIDGRDELAGRIRSKGGIASASMSDAELILAAYDVWGEACVEYLLGDFAFAIWDGKRQLLFLARDQLGVKPLFYYVSGELCVFSNVLDCVLVHPAVPDRLNDRMVADFLLFEITRDHTATIYDEIHRLAPGHSLVVRGDGVQLRQYWELPIDEPLYLGKPESYVDRFLELLDVAVSDRLRFPTLGVLMSGGLDSPALAAVASRMMSSRGSREATKAFTNYQPGADDEHEYAQLVADALGIPIEFRETTESDAPADWLSTRLHTPEPVHLANYTAGFRDRCATYASHSRIAFYGEGPDNALKFEWKSHCRELVRNKRFLRVGADIAIDAFVHRRIPTPSGMLWPSSRGMAATPDDAVPLWLNEDFERSVDARGRIRGLRNTQRNTQDGTHPYRPASYRSLRATFWPSVFESFAPANTMARLEMRHPFADLRLLRFLLAVPVLPWCRGKYLIRRAMRGTLPEKVLRRPKTTLKREIWVERVIAQGNPKFVAFSGLERYIDVESFAKGGERRKDFWTDFRVASLNYWLANRNNRPVLKEEAR